MTFYMLGIALVACTILTVGAAFLDIGKGVSLTERFKSVVVGVVLILFFARLFGKELKRRREGIPKSKPSKNDRLE